MTDLQETKIFEIASTVADACSIAARDSHPFNELKQQSRDVLTQLKDLLSNNQHLSNMLQNKIAQTPLSLDDSSGSDTGFRTGMAMAIDPSIETLL